MRYTNRPVKRRWPRRILIVLLIGIVLTVAATVAIRYVYNENLKPVSGNSEVHLFVIESGAPIDAIAKKLEQQKLIRSAWAFRLYVSSKEVRSALQAGEYELAQSQSIPEIVSQLTRGAVATNLVTILPGQRIDQVRKRLVQEGFSEKEVDDALNPANYADNPVLVDKPATASLEGYLYPDSYQKNGNTGVTAIITASLKEMNNKLTPDLRAAFARQGLSTYQAIILASIVEKEVSKQADRDQVAQVFLKRLRIDMRLQSDATTSYGAILAGEESRSGYSSAYNTYQNAGLPPTPVSNVTESSLKAVAYPATTDWLYFVSGDDGITHFSKTLAEQEANIQRFCKEACSN